MTPFILNTSNARERMVEVWRFACQYIDAGKAVRVEVKECKSTRSLEQNAMLHAICEDIARQRQAAHMLTRKKDNGRADALLIALYGEQKLASGVAA